MYMYIYIFLTLYTECRVARTKTKCCRSLQHQMKVWARQLSTNENCWQAKGICTAKMYWYWEVYVPTLSKNYALLPLTTFANNCKTSLPLNLNVDKVFTIWLIKTTTLTYDDAEYKNMSEYLRKIWGCRNCLWSFKSWGTLTVHTAWYAKRYKFLSKFLLCQGLPLKQIILTC